MKRSVESIQDELLVLRCQDGDEQAYAALLRRWQPRLLRYAMRLTDDPEAARDVTQDAWLAMVRGLRRIHDPVAFRAWAYRIVGNKCADWVRGRTRQRELERGAADRADDVSHDRSDGPAADEPSRLRAAIERLPEDQWIVMQLHYREELGVAEIAMCLDIPAGTVKSRLFNARRQLRVILERTTS